jgi:putative transcriptional regulator
MDFDYNFFKIDEKNTIPKKGKVLIAEPFLKDYYFKRSIILLTEHGNEGSVGFVLNKPVKMKIEEMVMDMPPFETMISVGGPVGVNSLHYIHTLGDIIPESVRVFDNVYWGGDFATIKGLLKTGKINNHQIRFFLGYSGWQPNQLNSELQQSSWIVSSLNANEIMNTKVKNLWKNSLRQLGKKYELWSNFPEDPGMN